MKTDELRCPVTAIFTFLLLALSFTPAYGQARNICPMEYTIGLFNGVWNTEAAAYAALKHFRGDLGLGTAYENKDITYEVFYNQTGLNNGGFGALQDLAETFEQRAQELDGVLANRWEIFWETLGASSDESAFLDRITTKLGTVAPEIKNLLGALYTDIATKSIAGWAQALSNPPTAVDTARHAQRMRELADNKRLLLIAHSQGNLFIESAFIAAFSVVKSPSTIKVVHLAPATSTLRGEYVLADLDLVINGLRIQGFSTVPPNNVSLPASHLVTDDPTGHKLVETYLNSKRDSFLKVKGLVGAALSALDGVKCVAITAATCDPAGEGYYSVRITGVASSPTLGTFIVPGTTGFSLGYQIGTKISFCDAGGWTGTAFANSLGQCERQSGDPTATTWRSTTVTAVAPPWNAYAQLFSSTASDPAQTLTTRAEVPLSCPGQYP